MPSVNIIKYGKRRREKKETFESHVNTLLIAVYESLVKMY